MKPVSLLIALLLGAPVLLAQMSYPQHRVRSKDRLSVQPYFVDNRIVFRSFEVLVVEDGMQIGGELLVDFDCDRAPAEEKLPRGPIMGLKIDVQLFDVTPVLTRNKTSGMVDDVHIDPRSPGRPVEGQATQCLTNNSEMGSDAVRLATATFNLPRLQRPLAPGIYHLVASMTFQSQGATQLNQIRWCGDFWGAEDQGPDPVTLERRIFPIIGDKARHDQFFQEVLTVQRKVEGTARLYLGDTLANSKTPILRAPFTAGDRTPPNFVIWGQLADRIKEVELLKGHPEQADRDLAAFKKNDQLQAIRLKNMQQVNPNATIKDVIKEQEEMTKILKQNAIDNLRLLGNEATKEEVQYLVSVTAGRGQVLDQIKDFQDYLVSRYWVLTDGLVHYGYLTVNRAGGGALWAVKDNDRTKDAKARQDELSKPEKADQAGYFDKLKQTNFKFQAPEITKAAEAYIRKWPFGKDLLSERFTKMENGKVAMDIAAWDKFRDEFLKSYLPQTKVVLDEIDTSINYHNQVWPATFAEAKAARDDVVCMAFAYEYQIRTEFAPAPKDEVAADAEKRKAELAKQVVDEWKLKAASDPDSNLEPFIQSSQKTAMAVYTQQRGRLNTVRDSTKMQDFANRYKQAIQNNEALPGKKK